MLSSIYKLFFYISIRTTEIHRYKIMEKMAMNSLIELTHIFKYLPSDYS